MVHLFACQSPPKNADIISAKFDTQHFNIDLYWKDQTGKLFNNIGNLNQHLAQQGKTLIFGANAGMFDTSFNPIGLFIENGIEQKSINTLIIKDTLKTIPNFYLQPNGIFYITADEDPGICTTQNYPSYISMKCATQSGPMLLVNGEINPIFKPKSTNLYIRNGVGILPNKELIFAMSKNEINFYQFAQFFKDQGCTDALYLDGYVCKTYLPQEDYEETDGELGVLIGITSK
jgi:uncharacterized protein YigE (DUF2233 family)